ncbi:condensation domain-containing protein [Alteromonas mediterranea]|nr:condensation domain-containing protein [Alteromonas mediterranea]AGP92044.1 Non-ribosomal peptide synthetase [Alteromonas mediterranea U8]
MTQAANWFPLSETQLDYWLLNRLCREQYILDFFVEINQALDTELLEECVNQILCTHNVFWLKQHRFLPYQTQAARRPVTLQKWDLTDCTQERQQLIVAQQLEQLYDADVIANLPMVEVGFFRLAEQKYLLFMLVPHLCADATSMQIITSEILRLYRYRSAGMEMEEIPMDEPYQFEQYLEEEFLLKQPKDKYQQSVDYWTSLFTQAEPLWLSSNWLADEQGEVTSFSGDLSHLDVNAVFSKFNDYGLTNYLGLVSLVSIAMQRMSGQSNFVVTALFNTRTELSQKRLVGPAYRELYLRPEYASGGEFHQTLNSVKEQFKQGMIHKHCEEALPLYLLEQKKWPRLALKLLPVCEGLLKLLSKTLLRKARLNHKVLSYYLLYYLYPACRKLAPTHFGNGSDSYPVELEVNFIEDQEASSASSNTPPKQPDDLAIKESADDRFSGFPFISVSFTHRSNGLMLEIDGNDLKIELKQLLFETLEKVTVEFLHSENAQIDSNQMSSGKE